MKSEFELSHDYGSRCFKIVELVERVEADLVIVGAHSHTMLGRLFMESNTDYVVHHVHCPMYIWKKASSQSNKIILLHHIGASMYVHKR